MDERDLEPEQPSMGLLVDHVDALLGELGQLLTQVAHLERDVMHTRSALREELADRRFRTERGEQLDAAFTDPNRRRLDPLRLDDVALLQLGAEQSAVGLDRLVQVLDRNSEMVDPLRPHRGGC